MYWTKCAEIKIGNGALKKKGAFQMRGLNWMPIHTVLYSQRTAIVNNLYPDIDLALQKIVKTLNTIES